MNCVATLDSGSFVCSPSAIKSDPASCPVDRLSGFSDWVSARRGSEISITSLKVDMVFPGVQPIEVKINIVVVRWQERCNKLKLA